MEALVISLVALFAILIIGGALLYSSRAGASKTFLEPPPETAATETKPEEEGLSAGQVADIERTLERVEEAEVLEKPRLRDRLGRLQRSYG